MLNARPSPGRRAQSRRPFRPPPGTAEVQRLDAIAARGRIAQLQQPQQVIGETITVTARLPFGNRKQLQELTPSFASERARAETFSMASTAGWDRREAAARDPRGTGKNSNCGARVG
ncbi:hypothetical protein [Streptomyces aurantiogriseus]|uniref:Uncharacterized protein n=1 Tax=Streptomyces aurantiogriseus TaxID=66870 RepID=A0A918FP20_9ACTN|nr:hypothetical protein [Streptomyces aurantiogriseus]GGR62117.1 hypothetical protein GCM10010251_93570 [Streptomyces aurantiogriseus]